VKGRAWVIVAGLILATGLGLGAIARAQQGAAAPAPALAPAAPATAPATPAPAAQPAAATAQSEAPKAKKVQVKHADKLSYDSAAKVYHLTGNVLLTQEDMSLYADNCDYDDKGQTAVATGHLKITDPDLTLTGDRVKADFNAKLAQIVGNVTIVTQKKKTEENGKPVSEYRQKLTTITCPQIDYYYADDKKQAAIAGPLKAVQEDKTLWADKADYDGVKDTVVLTGNIRVKTDAGSEFRCPSATISLKDDTLEAVDITGVAVEEQKPAAVAPEAKAEPAKPAP